MNPGNMTPSTQTFRLLLYQRALHPELFRIQNRRTLDHTDYELESWIMPCGHVLRYQTQGMCLSELLTEQDQPLPDRGLLQNIPCLGEKDVDEIIDGRVRYVTSIQTELLSGNLYAATYAEMRDFAGESEAMSYEWTDKEGGMNMSVLDVQRYKKEVHAQSYHLVGTAGFILRTQTIFELI